LEPVTPALPGGTQQKSIKLNVKIKNPHPATTTPILRKWVQYQVNQKLELTNHSLLNVHTN